MIRYRKYPFVIAAALALGVALGGCATPQTRPAAEQDVSAAQTTLTNFKNDPNMTGFRNNLRNAHAAMAVVARKRQVRLPADAAIDAEVDLNLNAADGTYFLRARRNVSLPGIEREVAQVIVNDAHQVCPYSRATRGNIDVAINLV